MLLLTAPVPGSLATKNALKEGHFASRGAGLLRSHTNTLHSLPWIRVKLDAFSVSRNTSIGFTPLNKNFVLFRTSELRC